MRHWTQDGAHIAALVTVGNGVMCLGFGRGWPAFATIAAGLLVLGLLRALETRDGFLQAVKALMASEANAAALEALRVEVAEVKKHALAARASSSGIKPHSGTPSY